MKLYSTPLESTSYIFSLLTVRYTTAQQTCRSIFPPFAINATVSQSLSNPFKPPTGPLSNSTLSNWTWTLATESSPTAGSPNTTIRNALYLEIQPGQNLSSPTLGYLGCGLVAHNLKSSILKQSQNDNGTCESLFSAQCIDSLLKTTADNAHIYSGSDFTDIHTICQEFVTLNTQTHGVLDECRDAFDGGLGWWDAFRKPNHVPFSSFPSLLLNMLFRNECELIKRPVYTAFASPQLPPASSDPTCSTDGSLSGLNTSNLPLYSHGVSTYSSSNMTAYENLTTTITPLVSVMFVNHTTDFNSTQGWSQSQLTCLRPSDMQPGSVAPTGVPSGAFGDGRRKNWGLLISVGLVSLCWRFY